MTGPDEPQVGVVCGQCESGPVYFETCPGRVPGHHWATVSECQNCGQRYEILTGCPDCVGVDPDDLSLRLMGGDA